MTKNQRELLEITYINAWAKVAFPKGYTGEEVCLRKIEERKFIKQLNSTKLLERLNEYVHALVHHSLMEKTE